MIEMRSGSGDALIRIVYFHLAGRRHSYCPVHFVVMGAEGFGCMRPGGRAQGGEVDPRCDDERHLILIDEGKPLPSMEPLAHPLVLNRMR